MAYNELIKNFEKVRAYMREFYVYGFKSRTEYDAKSARSYDDERRRLESWLGDYMRFTQTPEGKNVFLSVISSASISAAACILLSWVRWMLILKRSMLLLMIFPAEEMFGKGAWSVLT